MSVDIHLIFKPVDKQTKRYKSGCDFYLLYNAYSSYFADFPTIPDNLQPLTYLDSLKSEKSAGEGKTIRLQIQ